MLYPPDADHTYDPMSQAYLELKFHHKHAERQMYVDIQPTSPVLGAQVWPDYDIPEELLDDVLRLLTIASADAVYGDLSVEPIVWTRQRLNEAHARLRSRKAHTLLIGILEHGRVVALTELSRHGDADPEVCEWTLTVTDRAYRRRGFATRAKQHAQYAVTHHWPTVRRAYCSVAQADPANERALCAPRSASHLRQQRLRAHRVERVVGVATLPTCIKRTFIRRGDWKLLLPAANEVRVRDGQPAHGHRITMLNQLFGFNTLGHLAKSRIQDDAGAPVERVQGCSAQ